MVSPKPAIESLSINVLLISFSDPNCESNDGVFGNKLKKQYNANRNIDIFKEKLQEESSKKQLNV